MNKLEELQEEFGTVFSGRGARFLDSFAPLLAFLIIYPLYGLNSALWVSLAVGIILTVIRIFRKSSLVYSIGGIGGVLLASVFVNISKSGAGYFIPGLISGAITVVLCVVSVVVNRPLVAWTSYITRRWPLEWYWHPKVLPAYNEVTIIWAIAFSARLSLELYLYQLNSINLLGTARLLLGWPFTIALLIISYLYGVWRLNKLKGPGVDEFNNDQPPPWKGQKRGF